MAHPTPRLAWWGGLLAALMLATGVWAADHGWTAPDRAARVAALIPGRAVPMPSPDTFLKAWTQERVAAWQQAHPGSSLDKDYASYVAAAPTDADLTALVPDHISPYAIVLEGKPDPEKAALAMISWCPLCGAYGHFVVDSGNPHHAVMTCCRAEFYEREQDYPADYKYRPNSTARFQHLDGTVAVASDRKEVPGYTFTDAPGVKWQIFPGTLFALNRWERTCSLATGLLRQFRDTNNPLYAHKLAVLLDLVADAYYGLPFSFHNELATDLSGKPLTRAAWEAIPRPVMSGTALGPPSNNCFGWNRRSPNFNRGWVFLADECVWAEPFARVRHHPAFKQFSQRKYGDPEALDRKIMSKLMRDLGLLFKSFKIESDYQDGSYAHLLVLSILLGDRYLFDFAAGHQECVLYNHHYQDGMNGEGAPNYMDMVRGYYATMPDPQGWLEFDPDFLKRNPFFGPASTELNGLTTVRGLQLEFADQHIQACDTRLLTDPDRVRQRETIPSRNWPGYGIGILRVGGPGHRQEVFLTADRVSLHGAADKLGIECWVDGVPVMREGGYANHSLSVPLEAAQPETKTLLALPYPHPMTDMRPVPGNPFKAWEWVHCPLAHNTAVINELGTGPGWSDNEGFGDPVAYKGGEAPGEPGARFQVLEYRDLRSFERYAAVTEGGDPNLKVPEARRALLAVEGPDGRPYALDIMRLSGGRRHALYLSGWGDVVEEQLPAAKATAPDMATYLEKLRGPQAGPLPMREQYGEIRQVADRGPAPGLWGWTWRTDAAAYAPFTARGEPRRPLPEDVGRVRLRLIGLGNDGTPGQTGATELLTGASPWVAIINQPLPEGRNASGNVCFRDAWPTVIQSRTQTANQPLSSVFVQLLEGFREGEKSAIKQVRRLPPLSPTSTKPGTVGLQLAMAAGHTDTVIVQPAAAPASFAGGVSTDATHALIRQDSRGEVTEAHLAGGSFVSCGKLRLRTQGQYAGKVVDLIGDLTGTHQESALIIQPDKPWPAGAALAGRQLLIRVISGHDEAFTIDRVTARGDGRMRVDLRGVPPLGMGWYQVSRLDPAQPDTLKSNRQLWAGINTTWWQDCKAWFPERGKTFIIAANGRDRETLQVREHRNLAAEGIKPGDWFTIYAIEPGVTVSVAGDLAWVRQPARAGGVKVSELRATGDVAVTLPAVGKALWMRLGAAKWEPLPAAKTSAAGVATLNLPVSRANGGTVSLLSDKPSWLKLNDNGPPQVTAVTVDGQAQPPAPKIDLGRGATPERIVVALADADNPLDPASMWVSLDGKPLDQALAKFTVVPNDGKSGTITVTPKTALGPEQEALSRRHVLTFHADDLAIDNAATELTVTYIRLVKPAGDALYLSDLQEVSSFVHGGLRKDTNYNGEPLFIVGVAYPKSLQTHVETSGEGNHSEVIYDLRTLASARTLEPARRTFQATIGVSDEAGGGSVIFAVQVQTEADGPWVTRHQSAVLRGNQEPLGIKVDLTGALRLRLLCTDAGDGISSDHATWAEARLE